MADVYCDQALGDGNDDGTSWVNAYRLLATALNASNVVAGDTLWVKGDNTTSGSITLKGVATFTTDPPRVLGCKSATTATPPAQSDLIPGLRTGQSVLAYDDADAPTLTTTVAASFLSIIGYMYIYGLVLKARDNFNMMGDVSNLNMEECEIEIGNGEQGLVFLGAVSELDPAMLHMVNCKIFSTNGGELRAIGRVPRVTLEKCIIDLETTGGYIRNSSSQWMLHGCNFSAQSGPILSGAGGSIPQGTVEILNCKIHASSALTTGSIVDKFRSEFIQTSSVTGKTTGASFLELDIITDNGIIVEETTRFRTNGADDGGSGDWSFAFTPNVNGTRDNREGLIGPWTHQKIAGDGTAQTLNVFIANSSASTDYQDDEVWLEVYYPSEAGTAGYDRETTQLDLEGSATDITDDTGSTWGSGANNHQKLSVSISPDYTGRLRWRVVFAKNFASSPETLYVDPLSTIT